MRATEKLHHCPYTRYPARRACRARLLIALALAAGLWAAANLAPWGGMP